MSNINRDLIISTLAGFFVIIAFHFIVLIVPGMLANHAKCSYLGDAGRWGFWEGCMVRDQKTGLWISYEKWENVNGSLDIDY